MRIYSNTLLSLPHIIHALRPASIATRWDNIYVFQIDRVLTQNNEFRCLLEKNRKYYCYDKFYRNKYIEQFGNVYKNPLYIPQFSMSDDIFVIKEDMSLPTMGMNLPAWLKFYSPPLL